MPDQIPVERVAKDIRPHGGDLMTLSAGTASFET
jgi:hypothetical protein